MPEPRDPRQHPPVSAISNSTLSTPSLQRAWCLMLVLSLWPTIKPDQATPIAIWLHNGQEPDHG